MRRIPDDRDRGTSLYDNTRIVNSQGGRGRYKRSPKRKIELVKGMVQEIKKNIEAKKGKITK